MYESGMFCACLEAISAVLEIAQSLLHCVDCFVRQAEVRCHLELVVIAAETVGDHKE